MGLNVVEIKPGKTSQEELRRLRSRPLVAIFILFGGIAALLISVAASISFGAADINFKTVWTGVLHFNPDDTSHQIIQQLRMPRAIAAALVGAFLAVSGAIMQGMTRNPLASPSLMGVTAGSAFTIAIAFAFFPGTSHVGLMIWSFAGAGLGACLVFIVGSLSKGSLTPVKLALAGSAVTALLHSISSAIAIHLDVAQDISFWYAGGVAGTKWISIKLMLPVAVIGLCLAFILSRSITILSLGEDIAKGLGQRTVLVKVLGTIVVLLLTGAAVSVAGSVGFIGLVIPHITRFLVGVDYRLILPCAAVLGALLLVLADLGARMINPPFETPVGAITAIIGVPFFLYLARRERGGL
ncbi:iron ABC transporter permease [Priestia megaterium]|nr:iron ABC transporter permease [Priestia megaterium]